jgi:hypothetical protein
VCTNRSSATRTVHRVPPAIGRTPAAGVAGLGHSHAIDNAETPTEPTMNTRLTTRLVARVQAFALALVVTAGMLGAVDQLATSGVAADSLLARSGTLVANG